jgi:hypothetical protein
MTGGTWNLFAAARVTGVKLPTNQPAGPKLTLSDRIGQTLAYGTGSGQADIICFQTRTLTAGATLTLDLYTGTDLKDLYGDTAALRKVKGLCVWVDSGGDTSGVTVGAAATNIWPAFFGNSSDVWNVFPSGPPLVGGSPAGVAVGAATCNLKILNNGAVSVVVGIAIAGTSA